MKYWLVVKLKTEEDLVSKKIELSKEEYETHLKTYSNWKNLLTTSLSVYGEGRVYFVPAEIVKYIYLEKVEDA